MALWDRITQMMALGGEPYDPVQARVIPDMDLGSSSLDDLLLRVQGVRTRPWTAASIREALGVPAIFGAVNLIANTGSSMSMEAFRDGLKLPPQDRPRIIVRPDPFTIPREFYRSTFYNLATRGEAWWWIPKRDDDGLAMSIINVAPHEVTVEEDRDDLRYPIIRWRNTRMDNRDFRQLVYSREPGQYRGVGPLQMCGAAISVAVESQEWAANWYSSNGVPPIVIKAAMELGDDPVTGVNEATLLREQWMAGDANTPKVIDPGIEDVTQLDQNSAAGAMLEARGFQNSEVATMFNMDAEMLNAAVSGQSITYQNVGDKFDSFLRMCLRPNFLEVVEQSMTDLLSRSTSCRFDPDSLTMADPKTRWDIYNLAIPVIGQEAAAEIARQSEGLTSGDVENAPLPFAPPQAIPASFPAFRTAEPVRCDGKRMLKGVLARCNKLLSEDGTFTGRCPRCSKSHDIRPVPVAAIPPRVMTTVNVSARNIVPAMRVEEEPPATPSLEDITAMLDEKVAQMRRSEPTVNFHDGAFRTEAPVVNIPAPVVNMPAPIVNVEAAPAPEVTVHTDSFVEAVGELRKLMTRRQRIVRDADGRITGTEWEYEEQPA